MNQIIIETLRVLSIGMSTVFIVLMLFFLIIKALQKLFPYKGS